MMTVILEEVRQTCKLHTVIVACMCAVPAARLPNGPTAVIRLLLAQLHALAHHRQLLASRCQPACIHV